jgi:hypothetical protein
LYVDDIVLIGNKSLPWIKTELSKEFKIRDLGLLKKYLGIVFDWSKDRRHVFMHQSIYANKVLTQFAMHASKSVATPLAKDVPAQDPIPSRQPDEPALDENVPYRSVVGSLFYLLITRPDLAYSLSVISRHCHDPCQRHWQAVKRILRYVKGTADYGIHYDSIMSKSMSVYTDASHNQDEGRGQGGYLTRLGHNPISWWSGRFTLTGLSPQENEIMAIHEGYREVMSLKHICSDLDFKLELPILIKTDSEGGIFALRNGKRTKRNKHMDPRFFSLRRELDQELIDFLHVPTLEQDADMMTKIHGISEFSRFRERMGVVQRSSINVTEWV